MNTQARIAEQLNLSQATVSRVLSRPDQVNAKTRQRVLEAFERLGYRPNELANRFRENCLQMIGVNVASLRHTYFPSIIDGAEEAADERGYGVVVRCTHNDAGAERSAIEQMESLRFRGVLTNPHPRGAPLYRQLRERGVPFVFIDRYLDNLDAHYVGTDNRLGAEQAINHLVDLRHQRIGLVCGPQTYSSYRDRLEGYRRALSAHGRAKPDEWVFAGGDQLEDGRRACQAWLRLPRESRPTALCCDNDSTATGVLLQAAAQGISVPRDLSVIGFAGFEWTEWLAVPLTTVQQHGIAIGRNAVELLVASPHASVKPQRLELEPELKVRASTGPPSDNEVFTRAN
ncbi:MAG: LacI family DNA-binding transcriptional regulator [bacterium]